MSCDVIESKVKNDFIEPQSNLLQVIKREPKFGI